MRKALLAILAALLVGLAPTPIHAAAALVQQNTANQSFGTSQTAGLTSVASGSLLVACIRERDGGAITGVSDDVNGAWTLGRANTNGSGGQAILYYFPNSASGSPTVTVTFGANRVFDFNVSEWSGVQTSSPLDTSNEADNSSGTSHSHGSVTPSAASLMITCLSLDNTHGGLTLASGYNALNTNAGAPSQRQAYAYKVTHTGAESATATSINSRVSAGVHVAFLEASGGGGGGGVPLGSLGLMDVGK